MAPYRKRHSDFEIFAAFTLALIILALLAAVLSRYDF